MVEKVLFPNSLRMRLPVRSDALEQVLHGLRDSVQPAPRQAVSDLLVAHRGLGQEVVAVAPGGMASEPARAAFSGSPALPEPTAQDRGVNVSSSSVTAPTLIVHGTSDLVTPIRFGEKLFALANPPKAFWRVEGAGHLADDDLPGRRRQHAGEQIDECGLAGAIRTDQCHAVTGANAPFDIAQHRQHHELHGEHRHVRPAAQHPRAGLQAKR